MRIGICPLGTALGALAALLVAAGAFAEGPDRVAKKIDFVDTVWIWALEPDGERLRVVTRGREADGSMGAVEDRFVIDEHTVVRSGDDLIEPSALEIGDRVVIEAMQKPVLATDEEDPERVAREILVVVDSPRPQDAQNDTSD